MQICITNYVHLIYLTTISQPFFENKVDRLLWESLRDKSVERSSSFPLTSLRLSHKSTSFNKKKKKNIKFRIQCLPIDINLMPIIYYHAFIFTVIKNGPFKHLTNNNRLNYNQTCSIPSTSDFSFPKPLNLYTCIFCLASSIISSSTTMPTIMDIFTYNTYYCT